MGYDCVIIDSATHLWQGILADKENLDLQGKGNSFTNWAQPTKDFNATIQKFLQSRIHLISCMRSKTDYVMDTNERGKQAPRKVGLAPMMRDGIEYEFTVVFDVMNNHHATVSKDRTGMFVSEDNFLITEETGREIASWLASAKESSEVTENKPPQTQVVDNVPLAEQSSAVSKQSATNPMWDGISAEFPMEEYDRQAEIENVRRLINEGYFSMDDYKEAMRLYGVQKVSDLSEAGFESFALRHLPLVKTIIDEATKRNIPRAKLNEFARSNNEHSVLISSIETKKKIQNLVMGQTIPQQGNE